MNGAPDASAKGYLTKYANFECIIDIVVKTLGLVYLFPAFCPGAQYPPVRVQYRCG